MVISEIFHSLQGEGTTAGRPAVFVRLGLCNLQCNFCDTPYTWKEGQEDYSDAANALIVESIAKLLLDFPHTQIIVWTGGEPMLQQRDIVAAIDYLKVRFSDRVLEHEVETNGTITSQPEFDKRIDRYNCSPKTAMSGHEPYSIQLKDFRKTIYKYVVGTPEHCREALQEIDRQKLPRQRCFFMILGTTAAEMEERNAAIAEICAREGIGLCIRLQSILWGARRGV
ncbi:MAG: radical SAM protein [Candidatus Peregrinibacteria bacterium Greene0416_62]|nr:MAG: radical SAM protein [Candidatus Peregrinibacteria bacterium Greene0416_62]TSC99881.1 MAG: radical SAM protein [Candidatus Peregrinibacteria bacterium Greene1014_49]